MEFLETPESQLNNDHLALKLVYVELSELDNCIYQIANDTV